jgi:hypothetical protein
MRVKKANNKLSKAELTKLKSIEKQVTQDATVQSNLQDQTITQIRTTIVPTLRIKYACCMYWKNLRRRITV